MPCLDCLSVLNLFKIFTSCGHLDFREELEVTRPRIPGHDSNVFTGPFRWMVLGSGAHCVFDHRKTDKKRIPESGKNDGIRVFNARGKILKGTRVAVCRHCNNRVLLLLVYPATSGGEGFACAEWRLPKD